MGHGPTHDGNCQWIPLSLLALYAIAAHHLPLPNPNTMSSHLRTIVDAIDTCSKETGIDIEGHPFATNLRSIETPGHVLQLYQAREKDTENYLGKDKILVDQLLPLVHVVYLLSGLLGEAVSLVCAL